MAYFKTLTSCSGFVIFKVNSNPLLSFWSLGGSRKGMVHSHHLHCAFKRQCQAWHWQAKCRVPLNNFRWPCTSRGQRTLQTVQQRSPGPGGGDQTREQPRNEYHAHRSGPQPSASCVWGGAVHRRTVSTGAQWTRCGRGRGDCGRSHRGTASHRPRGYSVGTDGSIKADACEEGPKSLVQPTACYS